MRKLTAILSAAILLAACSNQANSVHSSVQPSTRVDSSYATYSLGNSIETFTTKVYIVYKDTSLMRQVDNNTSKRVDTTLKTYFIPRLDTLFFDQTKRWAPVMDSVTKKVKQTIVWLPIDERLVLVDYKK